MGWGNFGVTTDYTKIPSCNLSDTWCIVGWGVFETISRVIPTEFPVNSSEFHRLRVCRAGFMCCVQAVLGRRGSAEFQRDIRLASRQENVRTWCKITRIQQPCIPSGKRLHNYGKSPCYQWENPLFRLGHFLCRKLLVYQRVMILSITSLIQVDPMATEQMELETLEAGSGRSHGFPNTFPYPKSLVSKCFKWQKFDKWWFPKIGFHKIGFLKLVSIDIYILYIISFHKIGFLKLVSIDIYIYILYIISFHKIGTFHNWFRVPPWFPDVRKAPFMQQVSVDCREAACDAEMWMSCLPSQVWWVAVSCCSFIQWPIRSHLFFFLFSDVFRFFWVGEFGQKKTIVCHQLGHCQQVFFRFRFERMLGLDSLLTPSVAFTVATTRRVISWNGTGTRWPWLKLLIKQVQRFWKQSLGVLVSYVDVSWKQSVDQFWYHIPI